MFLALADDYCLSVFTMGLLSIVWGTWGAYIIQRAKNDRQYD